VNGTDLKELQAAMNQMRLVGKEIRLNPAVHRDDAARTRPHSGQQSSDGPLGHRDRQEGGDGSYRTGSCRLVIGRVLGNLKIFAGPAEIDAYSRVLRKVGGPELGYGDAVWLVRIVLLTCVNWTPLFVR
jgi:hypothetical protein